MDVDLLSILSAYLVRFGPVVLFLACLLETAVFAGLVLPIGALIAFAAMLSARGAFEPWVVAAAALSGAMVGDQLGFAVGRWFARGAPRPSGGVAGVWRAAVGRAQALLSGRRGFGISIGRAVPFVRTVMPWFAGRSGIAWPRYFVFDLAGVLLWGAIYVGGGFLAGEGWRKVADEVGEVVAGAAILLGVALAVLAHRWLSRRYLAGRRARAAAASHTELPVED